MLISEPMRIVILSFFLCFLLSYFAAFLTTPGAILSLCPPRDTFPYRRWHRQTPKRLKRSGRLYLLQAGGSASTAAQVHDDCGNETPPHPFLPIERDRSGIALSVSDPSIHVLLLPQLVCGYLGKLFKKKEWWQMKLPTIGHLTWSPNAINNPDIQTGKNI